MSNDDSLHTAAIHSLKRKAAFRSMLFTFLAVWVLLIAIWFLTGRGYFWPIWAILGMAIALVFTGVGAYGKSGTSGPSEAQINDEMKRLGGS